MHAFSSVGLKTSKQVKNKLTYNPSTKIFGNDPESIYLGNKYAVSALLWWACTDRGLFNCTSILWQLFDREWQNCGRIVRQFTGVLCGGCAVVNRGILSAISTLGFPSVVDKPTSRSFLGAFSEDWLCPSLPSLSSSKKVIRCAPRSCITEMSHSTDEWIWII